MEPEIWPLGTRSLDMLVADRTCLIGPFSRCGRCGLTRINIDIGKCLKNVEDVINASLKNLNDTGDLKERNRTRNLVGLLKPIKYLAMKKNG